MKLFRSLFGGLLIIVGIVLTILPGSSLLVLAGLVLLSIDFKPARRLLKRVQYSMSAASRKLDNYLLKRKFR